MKLACFYHCLFMHGDPAAFREVAFDIVREQMEALRQSELLKALDHFVVGINGDKESLDYSNLVIPANAKRVLHGPQSKAENLTIVEIEKWIPGHEDWAVLYFHAKGCTHPEGDIFRGNWRDCMMSRLVWNWQQCVAELDAGYESVGCHWMEFYQFVPRQRMWAGNFWWAKASFLATLPSIYLRPQIKQAGIGAFESRFEAEVWIGNGPRAPRRIDHHPGWKLTNMLH